MTESAFKRVLLIDRDDSRRGTRVAMLEAAGYDVELRENHVKAEDLDHETSFDLIILALRVEKLEHAAEYSDRLSRTNPTLPILLLTDYGVFVPRGTLSPRIEAGLPEQMMPQIAKMLAGSTHIRGIPHSFR